MTPRTRRFLLQIIPFGVLWAIFGLILTTCTRLMIGAFGLRSALSQPLFCAPEFRREDRLQGMGRVGHHYGLPGDGVDRQQRPEVRQLSGRTGRLGHHLERPVEFRVLESVASFIAALHCGNVTTGEIGVIKKDIIFTGDVLNTTPRIQGLRNPPDA